MLMRACFLLRFQETCDPGPAVDYAGRGTETRVKGEQPDHHVAGPMGTIIAGQGTKTAIKGEQPDYHDLEQSLSAIPGKGTQTEVKGEQPDHHPAGDRSRVIPRFRVVAGTQTTTKKFNDHENDPGPGQAHAIPRCC